LRVPALTIGDRAAHGWNPPAYAELLGIPYSETIKLAPAVLAQRLDIVLDTNQRVVGKVFIEGYEKRVDAAGVLAYAQKALQR